MKITPLNDFNIKVRLSIFLHLGENLDGGKKHRININYLYFLYLYFLMSPIKIAVCMNSRNSEIL